MLYLTYSTILAVWLFCRSGTTSKSRAGPFQWYYLPAQILFEVAANHAVMITILYFVLLGGGDMTDHLNVHAHVMNSKFKHEKIFFSSMRHFKKHFKIEQG